jgi:exopolysaccharide production protein ExoY
MRARRASGHTRHVGMATGLARIETPEVLPVTDRTLAAVDRIVAAAALVAAAPVLATAAAVIAIQSQRSPFIAHRRIGWCGNEFWMLKLRTMWDSGTPAVHEVGWVEQVRREASGDKRADDPRIGGRFAAFCRRHSLDELPQLWHVLTGEMSVVGPRPLTRRELANYYGPAADEVLRVRPGLTGLWQVSGRNRLTYRRRVQLDVRLARTLSLRTYIGVLSRTIPVLFNGDGAW